MTEPIQNPLDLKRQPDSGASLLATDMVPLLAGRGSVLSGKGNTSRSLRRAAARAQRKEKRTTRP